MIRTNLFSDCDVRKITDCKGCFSVLEYEQDISVNAEEAMKIYYASRMNVRKRQLAAQLANSGVILQAGAMQIMMGNISAATNVSDAGDLFKKFVGGKVTGETVIKPKYTGDGVVLLEPTYKFIFLEDLADWNGNLVLEDGMFLGCEDTVELGVTMRTTISSAVLGGEGLFNTVLKGKGVVAIESPVPRDEIIVVELVDDVLRIDGSMAVAWSNTLKFTVERTTKTLVGSVAAGEGLVNVYRGTGKVLIAPVDEKKVRMIKK